ncbi:MAG: type 1 glutamine amidotransferase [Haloechinothrix sp.]
MRALIIQPDPQCGPGLIGTRLEERGYALDIEAIVRQDPFATPDVSWDPPDPRDWDLVVALGARWSAYDDETVGSWLSGELKLLRTAHEAEVPVLGVCFGGQALARALGGTVQRAQHPEIGWVSLDTDEPGLVGRGPWFQWHFDQFTPPPGSVEIARNAVASQAFRVERSLGLQFHPELTESILEGWLRESGMKHAQAGVVDSEELRAMTADQMSAARVRANALVDAFLELR